MWLLKHSTTAQALDLITKRVRLWVLGSMTLKVEEVMVTLSAELHDRRLGGVNPNT